MSVVQDAIADTLMVNLGKPGVDVSRTIESESLFGKEYGERVIEKTANRKGDL